ncbi:MAG: hypothetical protein J0H68_02945 [Sphingobacteriia bacterium]|nr:hypothetical protein [Sphingobacteriia bacterium]
MQSKALSIIYQTISEYTDNFKGQNGNPILDSKAKSIITTILANTLSNDLTDEEVETKAKIYVTNLESFLSETKNQNTIFSMDSVEQGTFLSFIANGMQEKEKFKSTIIDMTTNELTNGVLNQDHELIEEFKTKFKFVENIKGQIAELVQEVLIDEANKDYNAFLKKVAAIQKKKQEIINQIFDQIRKKIDQKMSVQNVKISRIALSVAAISAVVGLGFAAIGGILPLDILLPASFGLSGGIVAREIAKISFAKEKSNKEKENINSMDFEFEKTSTPLIKNELKREIQTRKNLEQVINQKDLKDVKKVFESYGLNVTPEGMEITRITKVKTVEKETEVKKNKGPELNR